MTYYTYTQCVNQNVNTQHNYGWYSVERIYLHDLRHAACRYCQAAGAVTLTVTLTPTLPL